MSERILGKKEPEGVHVYVATPAYNGRVDDVYCQSMVEAAFAAPLFGIKLTSAVVRGGAFIDLSRNLFVHWFLNHEELKDCTHLFFIDSDLKFEARGLLGIAKAGLPIACGAYRRRQEDEDYPIVRSQREDGCIWIENDAAGGEWVMADRAPTGFMCISRKVLEEMAHDAIKIEIAGQGMVARLFYTYINEKNQFVGEDFAFCDDYLKRYQKPVPVWPDMDFVHGGFRGNYKAWLMHKIEEEKNQTSTAA